MNPAFGPSERGSLLVAGSAKQQHHRRSIGLAALLSVEFGGFQAFFRGTENSHRFRNVLRPIVGTFPITDTRYRVARSRQPSRTR